MSDASNLVKFSGRRFSLSESAKAYLHQIIDMRSFDDHDTALRFALGAEARITLGLALEQRFWVTDENGRNTRELAYDRDFNSHAADIVKRYKSTDSADTSFKVLSAAQAFDVICGIRDVDEGRAIAHALATFHRIAIGLNKREKFWVTDKDKKALRELCFPDQRTFH